MSLVAATVKKKKILGDYFLTLGEVGEEMEYYCSLYIVFKLWEIWDRKRRNNGEYCLHHVIRKIPALGFSFPTDLRLKKVVNPFGGE